MTTKHIIFATALLFTTMILACDEGTPEPELELNAAEPTWADEVDATPLSVTANGEHRPDRIIATVEPDPDTKIHFVESGVEGETVVDVIIVGRDGGLDYGGLLGPDKATPLELYLAFAEDEQPIPEALQRAHDLQVERFRGSGEERDILKPTQATIQDDIWENVQSTFSCLSWSNFQSYMATRFSSDPSRVETLSSYSDWHEVYNPSYTTVWGESQADMVVCNYETSSAPGYNDVVTAAACWINLGGLEDCHYEPLDDGHYLRRLYAEAGNNNAYRKYRAAASPSSTDSLQSYVGIVSVGGPD